MIQNYILTAFRFIKKQRFISMVNIIGLAIGIASCIIITLYVHDELSYDKYHSRSERIYRLLGKTNANPIAIYPGAMYDQVNEKISGIEQTCRITPFESTITYGKTKYNETNFYLADGNISNIFDWTLTKGTNKLVNPNDLIITQSMAKKYFGNDEVIGKILTCENEFHFKVVGVVQDIPEQSHFHWDFMGHIDALHILNESALTNWDNSSCFYYFLLNKEVTAAEVTQRLDQWMISNEGCKSHLAPQTILQPLEQIHLYSRHVKWDINSHGDITHIYGGIVIAIMILLIACFNFTNLSTAQSTSRSRETGVRKVMGADRKALVRQFLGESYVYLILATLLGLLIVELALPSINQYSGRHLSLYTANTPLVWGLGICVIAIAGLISGLYPAIIMARFDPIKVLKGGRLLSTNGNNKPSYFGLRQLLITIQFTISAGLIIMASVIHRQMDYVQEKRLGFDKEQLLTVQIPWSGDMNAIYHTYINEIKTFPFVKDVSASHNMPSRGINNYSSFRLANMSKEEALHAAMISVAPNFFQMMGSRIIEGRDFNSELVSDANNCIINETMKRMLQHDTVLGVSLKGFYKSEGLKIIGVIEDIHYKSLHENVYPIAYFVSETAYPPYTQFVFIRLAGSSMNNSIEQLKAIWDEQNNAWPFQYSFVDRHFNQLYKAEQHTGMMINVFTGLAVLISLMGLFGLVLFVAQTRSREMGIRFIMGASRSQVLYYLSKEFIILALLANAIAWPVVYWLAGQWLANFSYHVNISPIDFIFAAAITLFIVFITIIQHSWLISRIKPTQALRYE